MLMGYEIFVQNYWFPPLPPPGIINDHSLMQTKEKQLNTQETLRKHSGKFSAAK